MQHTDLVEGIKGVTEALDESGLRTALSGKDDAPDMEQLLDALRVYAIAAANFGPAEQMVVDLLGLTELDSSAVWASLLAGGGARAHYHERVGFVTHHLPRFVELLEESRERQGDESTLVVTVIGDGGRGIASERLVAVVTSVAALYRSCAKVQGFTVDDIALVSCDSTADTVLRFEGMGEAIQYTKELLTETFRWLALYREEELDQRLERAKGSLAMIQEIVELSTAGELSSDVAERLEQATLAGLLAFFDAGALIPEMEADMAHSPRDIVTTPQPPSARMAPPPYDDDASGEGEIDDIEYVPKHDSIIELSPEGVVIEDGEGLVIDADE